MFKLSYRGGKFRTPRILRAELTACQKLNHTETMRPRDTRRYTEIHASSLRTTVSLRLPSRSCQQVYVRPSYISRRLHATAIRRSDVCTVSDIWLCCSCVPYAGTYRRAKDRVARKWKNDKIQEESTKILRRGRWMLCCVPHVACTYFKLWVFERR